MGAFTHPHEAKMPRGRRFRCVEALSIVLDHQTDVPGASAEDYANRGHEHSGAHERLLDAS